MEFKNDLMGVSWENMALSNDIDGMLEVWTHLYFEVVNKHAPLKTHRVKKTIQPDWLSSEILDCMKERDKCKLNGNYDAYKFLRNKVSSMIQASKKETYTRKIENGKDNPSTIWKIFKEYGASQKSRETGGILGVKSDTNELISNVDDMSNLFNDYFVHVASKLKGPTRPSNFEHLRNSVDSKIPNETFFEIPEVSEQFVRKFLSRLDDSKATGLDNIGPRLLKMSANTIAGSITSLVNKSISSCKFPEVWKNAKVMPLFKSGAKDEVNNYWPISILPTLSKLIEKAVNTHLTNF